MAKQSELYELQRQLVMLAMLASDTPQFTNPFHLQRAKDLRDQVLEKIHNA